MRKRFEDNVRAVSEAATDTVCKGRIVSTDPLIVLSHVHAVDYLRVGVASALATTFQSVAALHVLALTWTCESNAQADTLARDVLELSEALPDNRFLVLTNTEYESYQLSRRGVPCMLASELAFQCERTFHPMSDMRPQFDALYNGRIVPFKRHELAEEIDSLLLLYGPVSSNNRPRFEGMRAAHPGWQFVNHSGPEGEYRLLSPLEVNIAYNRARVGLCLSQTEGAMRSSMEYLLAGLPVVSTPCYGGRERFLMAPYARFVEAEPGAVADAVADLVALDLDRSEVRRSVLHLVNAERRNFLRGVNRVVQEHYGVRDHFAEFDVFRGDIDGVEVGMFREQIRRAVAGQGVPAG